MTAANLRRFAVVVLGLVLGGATAFGLWHVVVGWGIRGNVRAGEFGIALAAVAGGLLAVLAAAARRRSLRLPG